MEIADFKYIIYISPKSAFKKKKFKIIIRFNSRYKGTNNLKIFILNKRKSNRKKENNTKATEVNTWL